LLKDRIRIHQSIDVGFDKIKSNSNFLIGYFQSYKYSNNPQVLASISSSVQRRICENPEWIRQMKSSNTLLVHVRLTDYLNEKSIGALEESYFRDAINFVLLSKPIKKIVLFSDDIERAKSAIPDDIDCVVHIYDDKFTIRGGVFYEAKTKGGRQYGTMGIGLKYQTFTVNAAYLVPFASRHPLQNQMRFSLLFDLASLKDSPKE
ncbi:MAG: hypothetical protein EBU80_13660, partial [Chitinophagia bacterium]|nr:hypothetical protein [Chitinophagia bacterium]